MRRLFRYYLLERVEPPLPRRDARPTRGSEAVEVREASGLYLPRSSQAGMAFRADGR